MQKICNTIEMFFIQGMGVMLCGQCTLVASAITHLDEYFTSFGIDSTHSENVKG